MKLYTEPRMHRTVPNYPLCAVNEWGLGTLATLSIIFE
jgi:hypothetical protein